MSCAGRRSFGTPCRSRMRTRGEAVQVTHPVVAQLYDPTVYAGTHTTGYKGIQRVAPAFVRGSTPTTAPNNPASFNLEKPRIHRLRLAGRASRSRIAGFRPPPNPTRQDAHQEAQTAGLFERTVTRFFALQRSWQTCDAGHESHKQCRSPYRPGRMSTVPEHS